MSDVQQKRKQVKADRRRVRQSHSRVQMQRRQLRHAKAVLKRREARLHAHTKELHDLRKAGHGAAAGVQWGLKQASIGRVESPPYSNSSPWMVEEFAKYGFRSGYSWCQYMANAIVTHGGGTLIPSGYTVAVVQYARNHQYGLRMASLSDLRVGDMLFFKWPGVSGDFCDHVGIYAGDGKILEGNTSPGSSGSQNNGGGLYLRSLAERRPYIVAVVRPSYTR